MRPRNIAIFRSVIDGATLTAAGEDNNISRERVRQVVYKLRRKILLPISENNIDFPAEALGDIKAMREYKHFWLEGLDLLASRWGIDYKDNGHPS